MRLQRQFCPITKHFEANCKNNVWNPNVTLLTNSSDGFTNLEFRIYEFL